MISISGFSLILVGAATIGFGRAIVPDPPPSLDLCEKEELAAKPTVEIEEQIRRIDAELDAHSRDVERSAATTFGGVVIGMVGLFLVARPHIENRREPMRESAPREKKTG